MDGGCPSTYLVHLTTQTAQHIEEDADEQRRNGRLLEEQTRDGQEQGAGQGQPLAGIPGLAPSHVPQVAQVCEQVADAGGHIGPAHQPGHRLRVDGVGGEEGARGQDRPHGGQEGARHLHHQPGGHAVEQVVDQVEAPRRKAAAQQIVQPEAKHAQRSPGAVGATVRQRCSPEVVREAPLPRSSPDTSALPRMARLRK